MQKFKIHVFEDDPHDQRDIKFYIQRVNKKLAPFEIFAEAQYSSLTNVKEEIERCDCNLIILDLIDDKTGKALGRHAIKRNIKRIPTLIYTSKAGQIGFEINNEKKTFPFLTSLLTKSQENDFLEEYLYTYIMRQVQGSLCFALYNENDLPLRISLDFLGLNRVNCIINQINKNLSNEKPIIYPMSLGLSGAILFKLKYGNSEYVLKMSKEIDKIKKEYENARKLYRKFPERLKITIEPEEYYSPDENVLGYFMNIVEDAQTLFGFILDASGIEYVNKILEDLFLNPKGLKSHYKRNTSDTSDWTSIFNRITESKFLLISNSYHEVLPLVKEYYEEIEIDNFRRLAIHYDYDKLSIHKLLDDRYKKNLVLAHGDLHAKNIMIQDEIYVKIIDTGLMEYAHWCSDVSRLIVSLFIDGVDCKTTDFFKTESIERYLGIIEFIINRKPIPLDGKNDNVFTAINWLVLNVHNIFDCFELFEYHLGLMKEFLQVSYRFATVPANRRAFSLIAADILMKEANKQVN